MNRSGKNTIRLAGLFLPVVLLTFYPGCNKEAPPLPVPIEQTAEIPEETPEEVRTTLEEPEEPAKPEPVFNASDVVALRIFIPRIPESEALIAEAVPAVLDATGDGRYVVMAGAAGTEDKPGPADTVATDGKTAADDVMVPEDMGDVLPPVIVLESPGNRSFYGSNIILEGSIRDSRTTRGDNAGSIARSYYTSTHPGVSQGVLSLTSNGTFFLEIDTSEIQGDIPLIITALDGGGNETKKEIVLLDDKTGPELSIITPLDNSFHRGEKIICLGKAQNSETDTGISEIREISWKEDEAEEWRRADLSDNGIFYFSIRADAETAGATIRVRGRDFNGYTSEKSVRLTREGNYPWIELSSHPDNEKALYNSTIHVEGAVQDNAGAELSDVPLTYFLVGSGEEEEMILSKEGEFALDLDMTGRNGLQFLLVKAKPADRVEAHAVLVMEDDGMGPNLELAAPEQSSMYEAYLSVRGRVTNSIEDKTDASEVAGLMWELPGINARDTVRFRKNGAFRFDIPMLGVRGEQTLKITCFDSNGNRSDEVVTIIGEEKPEESTLPLLTMTAPDDKDFYGNNVVLKGKVLNSEGSQEAADQIQHLYYWLEDNGPTLIEEMYFDLDGTFVYAVPTDELHGSRQLTLTAEKKDGTRTSRVIRLYDGSIQPGIAISSPENREEYGMYVMVQGTAFYPDPEVDFLRGVKRLSYEITPETFEGEEASSITGDIDFSPEGEFTFIFRAKELQGPQLVRITAEAWNGKRSDSSIVLEKGSSDIPSFTAQSADSSITLSWNPLPLSEEYILHAAFEGKEWTVGSVRPPHRITSLENGKRYTYTLEAVLAGETESAWSGSVAGIPLDTRTLKPRIKNEFGQIRLSWAGIPGADTYQVLRAESEDDEYVRLEEPLAETEFIDTDVDFRKNYFYKVTPALPGSVLSEYSRGEMLAAPQVKIDLAGKLKLKNTRKVSVEGNYLYLAAPGEGMTVVDITNAYRPKKIAVIPAEDPYTLATYDDYAFIANGEKGLLVFDISNPYAPEEAGKRQTSNALDVVISETHAYVADGTYGIKIIDITNPKAPEKVGTVRTEDAQAVELKGDTLYVADGAGGIKIYSVKGSSIREEGLYVSVNARDLSVHGGTLFAADGEGGLLILDISDRQRPTPIGTVEMAYAEELEIQGRHAFVLDKKKALKVIDIYDPYSPRLFETFPVDSSGGLAVHGDTAFIVEDAEIKIARVNVSGKSYVVGEKETGGLAYGVQLIGDYAFVADHQGGVRIIDVSNPFDVTDETGMATCVAEFAEDFALKDGLLYVADGPNGLRVFSLNEEIIPGESINPVSVYQSDGNFRSIFIEGTTGYCGKGSDGFEILDLSDPLEISGIASVDGIDARDITRYNDKIVIAGGKDGLFIGRMDGEKFIQESVVKDTYALKVKVQENLGYVAGLNGVFVIDLTNAAEPEIISFYESDSCEDIAVQENFVYLAQGYLGFTILDFSNPVHPVKVSVCDDIFAFGVDIRRGRDPVSYAYVTDSEGLNIVEVYLPEWLQ